MAGGICMNYTNYQQKPVIGYGGFGKVYQLNKDYAYMLSKKNIRLLKMKYGLVVYFYFVLIASTNISGLWRISDNNAI